jgi:hypothetical protein
MLATMHKLEIINKPRGIHRSLGDKTRGTINPVRRPIVTTILVATPPPAINMPHNR